MMQWFGILNPESIEHKPIIVISINTILSQHMHLTSHLPLYRYLPIICINYSNGWINNNNQNKSKKDEFFVTLWKREEINKLLEHSHRFRHCGVIIASIQPNLMDFRVACVILLSFGYCSVAYVVYVVVLCVFCDTHLFVRGHGRCAYETTVWHVMYTRRA